MAEPLPAVVVCKYQPELLRALLDLGACCYLVLDRLDRLHEAPDAEILRRCRRVYTIASFDSLEELSAVAVDLRLAATAAGQVVGHVVNQFEVSQFGAGYLGLLLGTTRDRLAHVSHRDKRLMKALVRAAGVRTARCSSIYDQHDRQAVARAIEGLGWPLVIKPAAGFGAMNTRKVHDGAEAREVVAAFAFDPLLRSRQLVVEEFIPGYELAVDAIWSAGRELALVVHRYHQPRMTIDETGLDGSRVLVPADHAELYQRVRALHARVNTALGVRDCATHLELFVHPDGDLIFSEIATRAGGAWIPGLLSAYHGRSIWELLAEGALTGTCPTAKPAHPYVASVSLRPNRAGIITAMPTDEELAAFPGVVSWDRVRSVGDNARLSHPSDYYLHVILGARTPSQLEERCRQAVATLTIEVAD